MKTAQHTRGPWEIHKMDNGYGYQIISENPRTYVIGSIAANGAGINGLMRKALPNARLISAAPDLLEALKTLLLPHMGDQRIADEKAARTAIAKAEGNSMPKAKSKKRLPPDTTRCQVNKYDPLIMGGSCFHRCSNKPHWIVYETVASIDDGLMGSQSVCDPCRTEWQKKSDNLKVDNTWRWEMIKKGK